MTGQLALIAIVAALVFGIATAALAQSRGQSRTGGWFLLGVLLGVFGLLIAAVTPRVYPAGWYPTAAGWSYWDGQAWR